MEIGSDGSAQWRAVLQGEFFPGYVCQAKCAKGYQWHPDISKCLMAVDETEPK